MRASDISQSGTYMAVNFSEATCNQIAQYMKTAKVPNPIDIPSLHCTIVHSSVEVPIEPNYDCSNESVSPMGLELWPVKNGLNVLVLRLNSPYLHRRFNESLSLGAIYDYDEYKPHVTLSYDAGDYDLDAAPPLLIDLQFDCEYVEELVS